MERLELVIFDFDDTLVHLEVDWSAVERDLRSLALSEGITHRGHTGLMSFASTVARTPAAKRRIDRMIAAHERPVAASGAYRVIRGMVPLLRAVPSDLRLAVASSNSRRTIRRILKDLGLAGRFSMIVGREDVRRTKPHPEPVIRVLRSLRAKRARTLYVGDSDNDRRAARSARVPFFYLTTGDPRRLERLRRRLLGGAKR
jgi:HAD superfamily hydrolase (TIGR01549 family)